MVKLNVQDQVELIRQYKRLEAEIASTNDEKKARILDKECQDILNRVTEANLDLIKMMVRSQTDENSDIKERFSDAYYRVVQCFHQLTRTRPICLFVIF